MMVLDVHSNAMLSMAYDCLSTLFKKNHKVLDVMKVLRKKVVDYCFSEYVTRLGDEHSKVRVYWGDSYLPASCYLNDIVSLDEGSEISSPIIDAWSLLLNYLEQKKEKPERFWFDISMISSPWKSCVLPHKVPM